MMKKAAGLIGQLQKKYRHNKNAAVPEDLSPMPDLRRFLFAVPLPAAACLT